MRGKAVNADQFIGYHSDRPGVTVGETTAFHLNGETMAKLTAEQAVALCKQAIGKRYWSLKVDVTSHDGKPRFELYGYVDGHGITTGNTWEVVLTGMGVIAPDSIPTTSDMDDLQGAIGK